MRKQFVARLTRRFVSRLFRDLSEFVGKLLEQRAQSPVRKFKLLVPTVRFHEVHYNKIILKYL